MRGKRVMVLTAVAFGFLVFAMVGVGPILPTDHGAARAGGEVAVKLLALGVDHRSAPTAVREALAFDGPRRDEAPRRPRRRLPRRGVRHPLDVQPRRAVCRPATQAQVPGVGALTDFLARFHARPADAFVAHLVDHHDEGAVAHLFRVAASLESLVLGEGQILGQVKEAHLAAKARKTVRADPPPGLRAGPARRQEGPRSDGDGPGQAVDRQRRGGRGPRGLRHLLRQDGAGHRRRQDGRPDPPAPLGPEARPHPRHQPQPRPRRGRRRAAGGARPSRSSG